MRQSAARIVLGGLLALAAVTLVLAWFAIGQLTTLAQSEAKARAQMVSDALAVQVQKAVAMGIPVNKLEGVDVLFDQWLSQSPDIASLALTDADQRVLWQRSRDLAAGEDPGHSRVVAEVRLAGVPAAAVVLIHKNPSPWSLMAGWMLPLAAIILLLSCLANEALRFALATTIIRRERLVDTACARIVAGDYSFRLPITRRREFDSRPQWLAARLRLVNEQQLRFTRLVQSLRKTEPDAARRDALDAALEQLAGTGQYRNGSHGTVFELPIDSTEVRWRGLLLGVASWAIIVWGVWWTLPASLRIALIHAGWLLPAAAVWLGLITWRSVRSAWVQGWPHGLLRSLFNGGLIGLLLIGPGLSWACLLVAVPDVMTRFGPFGAWLPPLLGVASLSVLFADWFGRPAELSAEPSQSYVPEARQNAT